MIAVKHAKQCMLSFVGLSKTVIVLLFEWKDHRDALSFVPDIISLQNFSIHGRSLRICSTVDLFVSLTIESDKSLMSFEIASPILKWLTIAHSA